MVIQKIVANQIDNAAEQIYAECILGQSSHLHTFNKLKEVLTNLAVDTIDVYCDTIKEKK